MWEHKRKIKVFETSHIYVVSTLSKKCRLRFAVLLRKGLLDSHERQIVIHSLVELKNQLIQQGRYTDCVDELIFKVANAPVKKLKIVDVA